MRAAKGEHVGAAKLLDASGLCSTGLRALVDAEAELRCHCHQMVEDVGLLLFI